MTASPVSIMFDVVPFLPRAPQSELRSRLEPSHSPSFMRPIANPLLARAQVLSLKDQENWEEFTDQVAKRWIALGLNPKPHW